MDNEVTQGYIIMEATMEPMKPKIIKTVNEPGMFYAVFESCMQSFDCFNRNQRNYALRPMMEAMQADHLQELMRKGTWTGENGHPEGNDIKRILSIDPTKICHRMYNPEFRGNLLYMTIETLNDDMWGKQFTKHLLQGMMASFSLRALAAITKDGSGRGLIKTKPHIVTYDRVILPSHREAYMDNSIPVTLVKSTTEGAVLTESTIPEGNVYDDHISEIKESAILEALDYVKDESTRVKELASFFNYNSDLVTFVNEHQVSVKNSETGSTLIINLEDYIANDMTTLFNKINAL